VLHPILDLPTLGAVLYGFTPDTGRLGLAPEGGGGETGNLNRFVAYSSQNQ